MPNTGTIEGNWKITIAETGSCLQSAPPPSKFTIDYECNLMTDLKRVHWGAKEFELEDANDNTRPHLTKQTKDPVVLCNGDECRALFGLIPSSDPEEIEVVVELLDGGQQGGGSARGKR